jgi:hypothetical protein
MTLDDNTAARATLSPCGKYRYTLERRWSELPRYVLWIMLNPSTADATQDDATIRRCVGYTRAWGYTGILVGNLYAFRATHPRDLERAYYDKVHELGKARANFDLDPLDRCEAEVIGPDNDRHLGELVQRASLVVCAWGQLGPLDSRRWQVMKILRAAGVTPRALKFNLPKPSLGYATAAREPSHPLRLKKALEPQAWEMFPNHGAGVGA